MEPITLHHKERRPKSLASIVRQMERLGYTATAVEAHSDGTFKVSVVRRDDENVLGPVRPSTGMSRSARVAQAQQVALDAWKRKESKEKG